MVYEKMAEKANGSRAHYESEAHGSVGCDCDLSRLRRSLGQGMIPPAFGLEVGNVKQMNSP